MNLVNLFLPVIFFFFYYCQEDMSRNREICIHIPKSRLYDEFKNQTKVNSFKEEICKAVLMRVCQSNNIEFKHVTLDKCVSKLKSYLKKLISKHDKTKKKGGKQYKKLLKDWSIEKYTLTLDVSESCLPAMHKNRLHERKLRKTMFKRYRSVVKQAKTLQANKKVLRKKIQKLYCLLLKCQTNKSARPFRVLEPNTGLSRTQVYRRKKMLMDDCKRSLSFVGRYNMKAVSVQVRQEDGKQLQLDLDRNSVSDSKENIKKVDLDALLYVKDSENISNKAYHELSMIVPNMPRLNSVVKRAKEIIDGVRITDTPNDTNGVQQSLRERLTNCVSNIVASGKGESILSNKIVNVKLTGDGTELGRRKKLINFGFTILDEDLCTSVRGNYLLAMFTGNETYDNVRKALEDIIIEAKELHTLNLGGTLIHVTYFLGGDLKFLNIVCGLATCSSTYSCVWCKCPSFDRHDMSREWSVVDIEKGARTVEEISTMSCQKRQNFNCLHPPLFCFIPLSHVIPDLLHLYLRVSDQLVKHLIAELRLRDNIHKCNGKYEREKCRNISNFEHFVQSLGIEFRFRNDKETGRFTFRDFTGPEHRKISKCLKVSEFISDHPKISDISFLWAEFSHISELLTKESFNSSEALVLSEKCKNWVKTFTYVYQSKDVTPYMHILAFHVPEMIQLHGNLGTFSQQGFEKLNDNATKWFFRSTSHKGKEAFKQIMFKQNRLEYLTSSKRNRYDKKCSKCKLAGHNRRSCKQ